MRISKKSWENYVNQLSNINKAAANQMQAYIDKYGVKNRTTLVDYAYALTTKFGEASAAIACEFYEALADLEGVTIPQAMPAETATYHETAKAVNGCLKQSPEGRLVSGVVERLTKQAGADTIGQNARRDGAQFAWIPSGDSCSFCIMLASRGWQKPSKMALQGNHMEHIHQNCDCMYTVRFNEDTTYDSYDPSKYEDMYYNNDAWSWRGKLREMDRKNYARNREAINARKRAEYKARKEDL